MKYCLLPATTMKPTAVFPECFHFNLALDSRAAINLRQPQIIDYLELFDAVKVNLRINPTNSDEFPQLESQNPAYQFAQLFHYDLLLESGKHRMEVSAATNFSRYHGTPGASIVRTSLSQSLSSTQLAEVPRVAIKPLIPTPLLCIYSSFGGIGDVEIHLALSIYCDRLSAYMNCHLNQLASLLVSGDFSDCKIVTNDGRQYNCHKAILCLKSEVIRMAFEVSDKKKMLESQTNEFRFDCDSQIAEAILLFVYKGEAPHITEDTAAELFRVAHLYQIVQLQSFLAYEIVKKATELVKISNVLEFVTFANRYDIVKFKTFCLSFIHANKSPVFSLPEWKEFYSNNRELVTQLLLM